MATNRIVYRFTGFWNSSNKTVVDPTYEYIKDGKRVKMTSIDPALSYQENVEAIEKKLAGWVKQVFKKYDGMTTRRGQFFERMISFEKIAAEVKPAEQPAAETKPVAEQVNVSIMSEEELNSAMAESEVEHSELFMEEEELAF
jgi:hypothetical protein